MKNVKDYLLDFIKEKDDWIRALVTEAINSNGSISENKIECILEALLYDEYIEIRECNSKKRIISNRVDLIELNHKQGVNAISDNQRIKFCKDINILFGMNGAGKSSYFRILNEMVGGSEEKPILPNINDNKKVSIKVDVKYSSNDTVKKIKDWDGSSRSLNDLNKCMVYDTSYQKSMLNIRESNETLIEPLGLHLFGYIINILDDFKVQISNKISKQSNKRPEINTECFQGIIKDVFKSKEFSDNDRIVIEEKYEFREKDKIKINEYGKEIRNLNQINYEDKSKLLTDKKTSIELLINQIQETSKRLIKYSENVDKLISIYKIKKKEVQKHKLKYQVFEDIPKFQSKEWEEFIKSGNKYSKSLKSNKESICPYCRQELINQESIEIIQAYTLYLKETTIVEFDDIKSKISDMVKEISNVNVKMSYQENISEMLKRKKINKETLAEKISDISSSYKNIKKSLIDKLENYLDKKIKINNFDTIICKLEKKTQKCGR